MSRAAETTSRVSSAAFTKFDELNELRRRGQEPFNVAKPNTVFRRQVMDYLIDAFGVNVHRAATVYNNVLKKFQEETPELVEGLGRPPDKKGGRKRKHPEPIPKEPNLSSTVVAVQEEASDLTEWIHEWLAPQCSRAEDSSARSFSDCGP